MNTGRRIPLSVAIAGLTFVTAVDAALLVALFHVSRDDDRDRTAPTTVTETVTTTTTTPVAPCDHPDCPPMPSLDF